MAGLDGKRLGMMAALTLGAACGSASMGSGTTATATTHGGTGGTTTKTTSTTTTTAMTTTTGMGGMGGAGGATGCNPPAAAGSLWAQGAQQYADPNPTSMCDYRGDVLLVVNTADV